MSAFKILSRWTAPSRRGQTPPGRRRPPNARRARIACLLIAWAAGAFCAVLGGGLIAAQRQGKTPALIESGEIDALKAQLRADPRNEALKAEIRDLDQQRRLTVFRRFEVSRSAAIWLLAGLAVCVAAACAAARLGRAPPDPKAWGAADPAAADARQGRSLVSVGVIGVVLIGAGAFTAFYVAASLSPARDEAEVPGAPAAGAVPAAQPGWPAWEEIRQQWPSFRGPQGDGTAPEDGPLLVAGAPTGVAVLWRSPIPLAGMNSPVRWGERIFVSGATPERRAVFCFDARDGALAWTFTASAAATGDVLTVDDETGYAAATPATDGRRVYAMFADGVVCAVGMNGEAEWTRSLGIPRNPYGLASSLRLYQDRLLVQFDQGRAEDGLSRLMALDTATGATLWEQRRPVAASWTTPLLADVDGQPQCVTCADEWAIAYDPRTGAELWRARFAGGELAPSPIAAGGLAVLVTAYDGVRALRMDGRGDVTDTHLAWESRESIPDICSPASDGTRVYLVETLGFLTCLRLSDGAKLWEQDLGMHVYASPTVRGAVVYLLGQTGDLVVIEAGDAYRELGRFRVEDACYASPVFHGDRMIIRGVKDLICVGPLAGRAPVDMAGEEP